MGRRGPPKSAAFRVLSIIGPGGAEAHVRFEVDALLHHFFVHDVRQEVLHRHVDVRGILSAGLEVSNLVAFGELGRRLLLHVYLVDHVDFVSNEDNLRVALAVLLDSVDPVVQVFERLLLCHVVNDHDAHCPTIVRKSGLAESVLTSCIPYLYLDSFVHVFDCFNNMVNTCRAYKPFYEFTLRIPMHETTFAYGGVP